ncbi:hypothetical protein EJB05_03746, partial [Eragrostis curvula]
MVRPRPALAINLFFLLLFLSGSVVPQLAEAGGDEKKKMVGVDGTQFVVGGGTVYLSGFNAYWLMLMASDPARRGKVVAAFRQASEHGLNLARTWAFSDGGDTPLQLAPGVYDEAMFQALDFVIAEAGRHGIYLLLCLTNNFPDFGGKRQYVRWARDAGHSDELATADDFFNSTVVKGYYKDYVKTVLTRVNSITGVAYRDDPTIFGWELMNEPRCDADPTGAMVQAWVEEMAPYVKSIDAAHLVTAGLEGFYGDGAHESKDLNPWSIYYGTNYIATHLAAGVDFATIHLYPDVWLWGSSAARKAAFFRNWTRSHLRDTELYLAKPLLVTEYGKFIWDAEYSNRTQRDYFLGTVLDSIYESARDGGPLVGGAFWQLLDDGMDTFRDGYEIVLPEDRRAAAIIGNHSRQLAKLNGRDADEIRRRRNQRRTRTRTPTTHRKIHVGSSSSTSGTDQFRILLVRFMSLLRQQISSFFSVVLA